MIFRRSAGRSGPVRESCMWLGRRQLSSEAAWDRASYRQTAVVTITHNGHNQQEVRLGRLIAMGHDTRGG
jgi:hypothetical protein